MIHRFLKFVDHYYFIILIGCIAVSLFFQLFKYNEVPPCINDDEAAFAYNAYSLLKTSKDEHGRFLPLRLESYGDYKLPLYGYFAIPFIQVFGMNETGIRALNTVVLILLTIVFFLLRKGTYG
jgi:4-amino-4-deoxy-L-arabinose transferase-like glycosyltransferase